MTAPRLSVVVPTYNRAGDLRRCLDSLVAQARTDFEVLVCDDGSTDDTASVVGDFSSRLDLRYLPDANWGGPARPRNRGIAAARCAYVAFLDSDDWWAPDKIAASLPALDAGADVVYHDLHLVTRRRRDRWLRKRVFARAVQPPVRADLIENGNALPLSSVVMRRSLLLDIGGMPEDRDLVAMEDYVCFINAAAMTDRFARIPGVHGYYWAGGGNISEDLRTLLLLESFERRFVASDHSPRWLAYARARSLYRLGRYAQARRQLALLGTSPREPMTMAKTLWMQAAMAVSPGRGAGA
jgi:glycosyltransferase involved in cell wall biosynthesis